MAREVANELAHRMQHHVYCDAHPAEASAQPDSCPFCADRAAYRLWQRKAGVVSEPSPAGPSVNVFDLHRAAQAAERDGGPA